MSVLHDEDVGGLGQAMAGPGGKLHCESSCRVLIVFMVFRLLMQGKPKGSYPIDGEDSCSRVAPTAVSLNNTVTSFLHLHLHIQVSIRIYYVQSKPLPLCMWNANQEHERHAQGNSQ